jgi:glycerol-3-phosphate acyltransferase PlsY
MIILVVAFISAYLLGAIPASYLIAKAMKGIDVRRSGSGNVGATNVLRTAGKLPALLSLSADILKGVIAVTLLSFFLSRYNIMDDRLSL